MTRDEIIRMAREAFHPYQILNTDLIFLERFAAIVAAHERENVQMVRAITLEEAAQLCMDYGREGFSAHVIARAIREMK